MKERTEGQISDRGRKKASSSPRTLTNHLLLSELALSLLFALIQVKLTPLADKWTDPKSHV